jgi:hypothetical protein
MQRSTGATFPACLMGDFEIIVAAIQEIADDPKPFKNGQEVMRVLARKLRRMKAEQMRAFGRKYQAAKFSSALPDDDEIPF